MLPDTQASRRAAARSDASGPLSLATGIEDGPAAHIDRTSGVLLRAGLGRRADASRPTTAGGAAPSPRAPSSPWSRP